MSQEVKTRALILQRYPFQEHRWILRLHTEREGTLSVLASRKKGTIALPGALVHVNLRLRPEREIQRLTEMEWDIVYKRFFHDPAHTAYLLLVIEWLHQCLYAPDPSLFEWIRNGLIQLDLSPDPLKQTQAFLVELLRRLGGARLPTSLSLSDIEKAYQAFLPNWKPIRSIDFTTFVSL